MNWKLDSPFMTSSEERSSFLSAYSLADTAEETSRELYPGEVLVSQGLRVHKDSLVQRNVCSPESQDTWAKMLLPSLICCMASNKAPNFPVLQLVRCKQG